METAVKLHSLKIGELRTYGFAILFVAGNIFLPQVCHVLPVGGNVLLPIYFFTLIAAYKYGFFTGIVTALASPLVNHVLFGMPGTEMLHIILIKSVLLALSASYMAQSTRQVKLGSLIVVILFYQGIGTLAEWLLLGNLTLALHDLFIGIPGILLQWIGGYFCLKAMNRW